MVTTGSWVSSNTWLIGISLTWMVNGHFDSPSTYKGALYMPKWVGASVKMCCKGAPTFLREPINVE